MENDMGQFDGPYFFNIETRCKFHLAREL